MHALAVVLALLAGAGTARAQIPTDAQPWRAPLTAFAIGAWGPDAPVASFAAQIHQESAWRPSAKSPVGAVGLSQFMPATASWMGKVFPSELADADPTNPLWSLRALVKYDRWLYDRIPADARCERMAFALSAYNGGAGWVYRRQKLSHRPGRCLEDTCEINPGIGMANQRENAAYPKRILRGYEARYVRAGWGQGACQ